MAVGGTYSVAPGLALSLQYVWAERRENGFDFLTSETSYPSNAANTTGCGPSGVPGRTAACLHNQTNVQMFVFGCHADLVAGFTGPTSEGGGFTPAAFSLFPPV